MKDEIGEIIVGKKPARTNDSEITPLKSNGLTVQDVATAELVYDKAVATGIGNF